MRFFILLLSATILTGCSPATITTTSMPSGGEQSSPADVEEGSPAEVSMTPETGDTAERSVYVIDVRSQKEWDSGHVEQAFHIPHTEIGERISEVTADKDAKIVLYCAVGGRAGRAKAKLEELGFTNVENAGGFDDVKDRFK